VRAETNVKRLLVLFNFNWNWKV